MHIILHTCPWSVKYILLTKYILNHKLERILTMEVRRGRIKTHAHTWTQPQTVKRWHRVLRISESKCEEDNQSPFPNLSCFGNFEAAETKSFSLEFWSKSSSSHVTRHWCWNRFLAQKNQRKSSETEWTLPKNFSSKTAKTETDFCFRAEKESKHWHFCF